MKCKFLLVNLLATVAFISTIIYTIPFNQSTVLGYVAELVKGNYYMLLCNICTPNPIEEGYRLPFCKTMDSNENMLAMLC